MIDIERQRAMASGDQMKADMITAQKPADAPKVGDRSVCQSCGRPIEFKGEFWSHRIDGSPEFRHIAKPK